MEIAANTDGLRGRTAPIALATLSFQEEARMDVTVLGDRLTGLSSALQLAESNARVVGLEAGEVGFGAFDRNVGLANAGMWTTPEDVVATLGPLNGERIVKLLVGGTSKVFEFLHRHAIECEAEPRGTLHCATGAEGVRELEQRARQWQARCAPVQLLDRGETTKRVGTAAYEVSLLDLRAGTILPLAYLRGLAAAASRAGVGVCTRSAVTSIERRGESWWLTTGQGSLEAPWIIVAVDSYGLGSRPEVVREQLHLPYFNFSTAPLSEAQRRPVQPGLRGCWDTKEVLTSFRLERLGRLVFGSVEALRGGLCSASSRISLEFHSSTRGTA